jgi:type IV pilus assembly protein PilO
MAVMADFAKLPTERKVLAFVVGAGLLGLLYFQFFYKPLKADLEEAQGEHDAKVALNAKLEREIPEFADMKRDIVKLNTQISANDKALPTEAELPAFFETLNRKVTEAGVEVAKWKEGNPESVESFVRVPIDIELTGTYMQIERFFASLVPKRKDKSAPKTDQPEELDRIVSIEYLSFSNPVVRNRDIVLTA